MSGMDQAELELAARAAVALAGKKGAQGVAAGAYRSRHVEVSWRDGRLEKVSEATSRGLGFELYVDGRYSAVGTSDLRPEALDRFLSDAVALTRKLEPDPYRTLPDPALYGPRAQVDLELEDPSHESLTAARRREIVAEVEAAAREVKGAEGILSVTTSFSDSHSTGYRIHSNGFEGSSRGTDFWIAAEVSAKDPDGRRPEDWSAVGSRFYATLPDAAGVGRTAAVRALSRLGSRKGESAVLPMLVENRCAARLVSFLLNPLSGGSLQQRRSFMEGKLGETIGSPALDIRDDPHVKRGFGSRLYDREGLASRPFQVFKQGKLASYFIDTYYGKKLRTAPTTRGPSNLAWGPGVGDQVELAKAVGEGILVTGFLGGNSNGTTGDFSLGAQGFRIRGGQLGEPVGEMNVSGNHLELWHRLAAVGSDPYPYSAMRTPSLLFEGVQFAGL